MSSLESDEGSVAERASQCHCSFLASATIRPRLIYISTFIWLTVVGGRFLAPFLEHEANLTTAQIGQALSVQQICIMLLSSVGGYWADWLEHRYNIIRGDDVWSKLFAGRGRLIVIGGAVTLGTFSFLLHGLEHSINGNNHSFLKQLFRSSGYHVFLQAIFGCSMALLWPVLDGLTIDHLKGHHQDYGKERLHGPLWWAMANLLLSPLLDRVGFAICYPLAIVAYVIVIVTLALYDWKNRKTRTSPRFEQVASAEQQGMPDDFVDERDVGEGALENMTATTYESESDIDSTDHIPLPRLLWMLVTSGGAFMVCLFLVSSGQAIVDNLSFLFLEGLGSTWLILGVSVVIKIVFEVPVFFYGERLLHWYGAPSLLLVGTVCYFLRAVAYTLIPKGHASYVLALEPLHGITYGTVQVAMVDFAAESLPAGHEAAGQGLIYLIKESGSVLGVFVGGWADAEFGPLTMFRASALVVFVGSAILATDIAIRRIRASSLSRESMAITSVEGDDEIYIETVHQTEML